MPVHSVLRVLKQLRSRGMVCVLLSSFRILAMLRPGGYGFFNVSALDSIRSDSQHSVEEYHRSAYCWNQLGDEDDFVAQQLIALTG